MSKYVDRIIEEVNFNFERHFHDKENRVDFLEELIEELKDLLEYVGSSNECDICLANPMIGPGGECDCEPEPWISK